MHNDPFWFCEIDGCEGVSFTCKKTCPYGKMSSCPPLVKEPTEEHKQQCRQCPKNKSCTKADAILGK